LSREAESRAFGVVLEYEYKPSESHTVAVPPRLRPHTGSVRIGLVGAGAFARSTLIPALKDAGAELTAVATETGLTAADVASRFGFERAAVNTDELLADESIDALVVATRHSSHARLATSALEAGTAVFVEKPLALDEEELEELENALASGGLLMVGFNRRFAPLAVRLREELEASPAAALLVRVNAGALPDDHWLHDTEDGGGRILGEGCHFVDLLSHLAGAPATSVHAIAHASPNRPLEAADDVVASLRFANGAVGTLLYSGSGDPQLPKERIETFGGGLAAVLDDFRRLELYRAGKRSVVKGKRDKGHRAEIARFVESVRGETEPPSAASYLASTRATFAVVESLRTGAPVEVH
jgi:predicted dehydrogenase